MRGAYDVSHADAKMLPLRSRREFFRRGSIASYRARRAKHRPAGVFASRRNGDVGLFCGRGQARCGVRRSIELLLDLADDVP
jgi:hypothetical protein